jgi:hypothetical protein
MQLEQLFKLQEETHYILPIMEKFDNNVVSLNVAENILENVCKEEEFNLPFKSQMKKAIFLTKKKQLQKVSYQVKKNKS